MKDRITLLIKAKNLTAAQFADEIGVQKSSISHILSGRNNASLDFIQKILTCYPEVNTEWLMFGNGPIFKNPGTATNTNTDGHLPPVPAPVLPHVDLFSEVSPAKGTDYRQENDLSSELILNQNAENEDTKNEAVFPLKEKKQIAPEVTERKSESNMISSVNRNNPTKTILKIVEFYSDNTYREYFPD